MKVVLLGSGNWGLAMASVFSQARPVVVWAKDEHELENARKNLAANYRYNAEKLVLEVKYSRELSPDDILIVAVPSSLVREVARETAKFLKGRSLIVVSASKGLEQPGFKTNSCVLREELPQCKIGAISGPTIAKEVGEGRPAKAVLAAYDVESLMRMKYALDNPVLKFELSLRVVEVEFCAALKGVIAIGAGIADGLNLGKNFMGLLLTYGMQEFMELGRFFGISTQQMLGIAGLGDLITTCWSSNSRNHRFGYLLSQKVSVQEALNEVGMVVEGIRVAKDVAQLVNLNVPVEIFSAIAAVIDEPSDETLAAFVKVVSEYRGSS